MPVIGWNVRPRRYSSMSRFKSVTTCGVIHPAQTLSRGNTAASTTITSRPARRSAHAQVDPAGPPPTMSASHERIQLGRVHGISLLLPRANTTWNSCIVPVMNAACDPAR